VRAFSCPRSQTKEQNSQITINYTGTASSKGNPVQKVHNKEKIQTGPAQWALRAICSVRGAKEVENWCRSEEDTRLWTDAV